MEPPCWDGGFLKARVQCETGHRITIHSVTEWEFGPYLDQCAFLIDQSRHTNFTYFVPCTSLIVRREYLAINPRGRAPIWLLYPEESQDALLHRAAADDRLGNRL